LKRYTSIPSTTGTSARKGVPTHSSPEDTSLPLDHSPISSHANITRQSKTLITERSAQPFQSISEILTKRRGIFDFGVLLSAAALASALVYVVYIEISDYNALHRRINSPIHTTIDFTNYIQRKGVEASLRSILQPKEIVDYFYVIVGEDGCGKSTLVQSVCKDVGEGVIFVDVPESINDFGKSFAEATGYVHLCKGIY